MAIRKDRVGQLWLFPPCITDFIPEYHICNLVVVVDNVDAGDIEKECRSQPGYSAYPRRMLLRLLVQATYVW